MKRLVLIFLAITMYVNCYSFDVVSESIYYNLHSDNTAEVTYGYKQYTGEIHVPENILINNNIFKVTKIGIRAFNDSPQLVSLYLSSSIVELADLSIANCKNLSVLYIPASVKKVALNTFSGTNMLAHIYTGCSFPLKKYFFLMVAPEINIIDGTTVIDSLTFAGSKLRNINLPLSVREIRYKAFKNCDLLSTIKLPAGIKILGDEVFYGCKSIVEIVLPSNTQYIGHRAFFGCSGLKRLEIPLGLKLAGNSIIDSCSNIEVLKVPVNILNNSDARALPDHLKFLETGGGKLNNLNILTFNAKTLINIDLFNITNNELTDDLLSNAVCLKNIVFPAQLVKTGIRVLANCISLENIVIPSTVVETGKAAFEDCKELKSVLFGVKNSLVTIGNWTFANCKSIEQIQLPWGVKNLGDGVFSGCTEMQKIILPTSCIQIGANVFSGCVSLKSIQSESETPPLVKENTFAGIDKNTIIFVPVNSVKKYQSAMGWKEFRNIHVITK